MLKRKYLKDADVSFRQLNEIVKLTADQEFPLQLAMDLNWIKKFMLNSVTSVK